MINAPSRSSYLKRPSRSDSTNPQSAIRNPQSGQPRATPSGTDVLLPDLIALRAEAHRLDISPRGKVLATKSGGHLSRFRGRGMEFDESRVYQPGDDVRNMDWRVTARAGTPHVKLFREERERPVWLLADLGPAMRFGTRVAFKSVIAARAAALLAWAAADKGDRVGGLVFDEARHFEQRPAARTRGLLPLLDALAELSIPETDAVGPSSNQPSLSNSTNPQSAIRNPQSASRRPKSQGFASLSAAAAHTTHLVRPGSLIFLLSDFAGLGREDGAWLARLGSGSEVVLVQIYDPLETAAPPPGLYPVTDGRRRGLLDTAPTGRRDAWHRRFAEHAALLDDLARRHRAHMLRLCTDEPVGPALARGLRPRRAGQRR
jgi:uncharacterized protein (DUF58 family)